MKVKPAADSDENNQYDPYQGRFYQVYRKILEAGLRNRVLVLGVVGAAFVAAIYGFTLVPQSLFPPGDRNQYLVYLDLPAGTRIEETDRTVRKFSAWLQDKKENPEITGTIAYVGTGGPRFFLSLSPVDPDPFNATLIVNTQTDEQAATACSLSILESIIGQIYLVVMVAWLVGMFVSQSMTKNSR